MTKQTHSFQAEVAQLLHLVTHSLYSNKEIFLRELISNASDACDKLRFEAINDSGLYESDADLKVKEWLGGPADVVMSDMAAAASGHKGTDHLRIIALCEAAAQFAFDVLEEQVSRFYYCLRFTMP